jgi:hypothetical protein
MTTSPRTPQFAETGRRYRIPVCLIANKSAIFLGLLILPRPAYGSTQSGIRSIVLVTRNPGR